MERGLEGAARGWFGGREAACATYPFRADIHTLFDRALLAVDPESMKVVLHPELRDGTYARIHGTPISMPAAERDAPSIEALSSHIDGCGFRTAG